MRITEKYLTANNLQVTNPGLAEGWHPTKNGSLTPKDVTLGSHKRVWWTCPGGHEWQARIGSRSRGSGCPYCSAQAACRENCLQNANHQLAREWHPTKNGNLTPSDVTPMSDRKVWWICHKGHEWLAVIEERNRGTGCPYCAGKAVV
jgi:hypothetical protein